MIALMLVLLLAVVVLVALAVVVFMGFLYVLECLQEWEESLG